jgi:hypothetical protein
LIEYLFDVIRQRLAPFQQFFVATSAKIVTTARRFCREFRFAGSCLSVNFGLKLLKCDGPGWRYKVGLQRCDLGSD